MKKLVIRIATIAAAFLLGVAGMSYFLMAGNTDSTAEMAGSTLPLIYMEQNGRDLNLLHGYTKSMDAASHTGRRLSASPGPHGILPGGVPGYQGTEGLL